MSAPLTHDTPPEVERLQIAAWRAMSPTHKASLITGMTQTARTMALAGIRHRHPDASMREQFLRLAILTLGVDLARRAYPEINDLDLK